MHCDCVAYVDQNAPVPCKGRAHEYREVSRDSNHHRIRTLEVCRDCGEKRLGCYAFHLDEDGNTAWGPPGEWWYS